MLHESDPVGVNVDSDEKVGGPSGLPVIGVVEVMGLPSFDHGPFPAAIAPLEVNGRPHIASVREVDQCMS